MAAAPEAVLHRLEDPAAPEVLVLLLDAQLHHGVDHVLELLAAGHLAVLRDLADDDSVRVVGLAPVSDEAECTHGRLRVRLSVVVVAVIHALERVDDEEEGLAGVLRPELVALQQERGDVGLLADREAGLEAEPLSDELHLEEALLGGVEHDDRSTLREPVSHREGHGGLARAGRAGEEDDLAGREALTTECTVHVLDARLHLVAERLGNLDREDVGAEVDGVVADVELHELVFLRVLVRCPLLDKDTTATSALHVASHYFSHYFSR